MLNLEIAHTLLQLKENHSKLGKEGTVFSVVDYVLDVQTGETKLVLGKSEFDTERGQMCTQLFGVVDKLQVENFFYIIEETYSNYILKLSTSYKDNKESQTKKEKKVL